MSVSSPAPSLSPKSAFGGAMIIAGTAVGAGMFSIPIVTSGVWFSGSVILLIYTWVCMLFSGLMLLEANLHYPPGASFHTVVKSLLGPAWNLINGLSVAFVLYILTYAYISAGGSIVTQTITELFPTIEFKENLRVAAGLGFAVLAAVIVWHSTWAVDRMNTILIGGMVIAFVFSVGGMFTHVKTDILFNTGDPQASYLPYALVALPYLLASFGYHGNVAGLIKYYDKDAKAVARSLFYGSLIALVIYIAWQFAIQGNIERADFKIILSQGGNVDNLLAQLDNSLVTHVVKQLLTAFAYMALASSFLGVSLGLLDYIADFLKLSDRRSDRAIAALCTFVPPTIGALLFPNGFLYAIGFAGLAATIWAVIVPAMLARKSRKQFPNSGYRAPGGKLMIMFVILFGILNAVVHISASFGLLPEYR